MADLRKVLAEYVRHRPHRSRFGRSVPVFGYGFLLFLGFLSAGWLATIRARREGIEGSIVWDLAMWIFLAGILGARVFYVVQKQKQVFADAKTLADYAVAAVNVREGGLVFYGSVIGGLAGFLIFCRRRRLRPLQVADMVVPSIFVGLALGRIGCFLNGSCFGDVASLPWSVSFPLGSVPDMALVLRGWVLPDAVRSLPLHPTQLYSSMNALVLAVLAWAWFLRRRHHGEVSALALVSYAVTRFTLEILRGDELGQFGTRFTISQWISFGLLACGIALAVWCRRTDRLGQRGAQAQIGTER
ncbi:MAG TPA: prolipoprotein diacylglyceryl transferase [Planctomycetaceae bacterium]|nr:prolipoprotein diacylglyceryl transferase [Planctomycetaceae bacterium]